MRVSYKRETPLEVGKIAESVSVDIFPSATKTAHGTSDDQKAGDQMSKSDAAEGSVSNE